MNRLLQRWLEREKPLFPKLRAIPLFRELNRRELQAVVQLIEICKYSTGDVVFEQGAPGDGVYVVLKGCVEVIQKDGEDGDKVLLTQSKSGSFFGETALLEGVPRTAAAVAAEDTKLALFSRDVLYQLAEQRPHLGVKIAIQLSRIVAERLRQTNHSLQAARDELAAKQKEDGGGES
ncbi:MAG: cyclic nucleotide-binding domain-containing protein [Candidatus Latescibacteria bacterium]|nr:cyclic nucleotide-binding domain-containing protein [Candidatus Latescibacterota bacterium]